MSVRDVSTRSGVQPNNSKLEFTLTTAAITKYLAEKIKDINETCKKHGGKVSLVDPDQIEIQAIRLGKGFIPILIILPEQVLKENVVGGGVSSIFLNENDTVPLKPFYWAFFNKYMYNKGERQAFNSRALQRQLGIASAEYARLFRIVSTPQIEVKDKGTDKEKKTVVVILDVGRIAHDMLTFPDNPNQNFEVKITDTIVMKDGAATYEIERVVRKKKKDKADANELLKNILKSNR